MRRRDFIAGVAVTPAAWTLAAHAQRHGVPVIGYVSGGAQEDSREVAFRQGLAEQGFLEGRNVEVLYRWANTQYDHLPTIVAEMVNRKVSLIATGGGSAAALAAKSATATTPIVFAIGNDPVELGLVASLNRPGGNATGVSVLLRTLAPKRLELLHEIVPAVTRIGFLENPRLPQFNDQVREVEKAADILGVELAVLKQGTLAEIEATFASLAERRVGALLCGTDILFFEQRNHLATLAARYAIPAIYGYRETTEAGGLVSYGASITDAVRLAGIYAGRILKGEKPSDLPVQQSTKIDMVLNLKTAKALGIEVPTATLLRATEVIE